MKINKFILSAAIASVLACSASAGDNVATIDITGSTAFRSSIHTAILNALSGETYAYTGTAGLGSASQAIFVGTLGGNSVTVRTTFTGSADGVRDLAQQNDIGFLAVGTSTSAGGTANTPTGTDQAAPDIAFSDVYQSSTLFKTPTLVDSVVAVVPFKFIASPGSAAAGLTNVTVQTFRTLFGNGVQPLSVFSGNSADEGVFVYATGRDAGSGTRITTLAETGYGINKQVVQFQGTVVSDVVTALAEPDNGGYSSGGTLNTLLHAESLTNTGGYLLGYLGLPDATTALTGGASELTYNGVSYSANNVYNGKYTFWGYQHLFTLTANPGNNVGTLKSALISAIAGNPGASGLQPSLMRVQRSSDGGAVVPTFF